MLQNCRLEYVLVVCTNTAHLRRVQRIFPLSAFTSETWVTPEFSTWHSIESLDPEVMLLPEGLLGIDLPEIHSVRSGDRRANTPCTLATVDRQQGANEPKSRFSTRG